MKEKADFEGIPLGHINQLVVKRDVFFMVIRITLNGELLLEASFWEITGLSLTSGDFAKLPRFMNLNQFIAALVQYLDHHTVTRKVNIICGSYEYER